MAAVQDQEPAEATARNPTDPTALAVVSAAAGGLLLAASVPAPSVPVPPVAAYLLGFVVVGATTLAAGAVAPVLTRRWLAGVVLPVAAVLLALYLWSECVPRPLGPVAVTVALLLAGGAVGGSVGGRIEHPGHLLVVAVVSLLVDTFSVYHPAGPTAAVVARPEALAVLALSWPMLGTSEIVPILGVGDVVFAALYLSASRRHGLGRGRTALALAAGLVVTLIAVVLTSVPIPALVGMGLAVLAVHPEARRLPAKDRRKGRIILAVLAALWLAVWLRNLAAMT